MNERGLAKQLLFGPAHRPSPTPIHYTLFPPSLLCIFAINQEKADWDSRAGHAYLSILVWHLNSAERTVESGWSPQRRRTFLSHNFGGAPSAPPTFVGQRLRIYFLILLTRHENIQNAIVPTSTMHSTNSPCSVCGSCFCVLTCVRLMLISSGATLDGGGGGVEVLGGGHAPRTFAPAKNEMPNEKLNCVTRWQDSGVGAAVPGLEKTKTQTQISCILHSTYQSLNPYVGMAWWIFTACANC